MSQQPERPRDEGMALMFALMFVAVGSMLILPLLTYAQGVMKATTQEHTKAVRAAAATGALRVVLADPSRLFKVCSASGLHVSVDLAVPDIGTPVSVKCTTTAEANELQSSDLRVAMAVTAAGSVEPVGAVGGAYANSGSADPQLWWGDVTTVTTGGKIWMPNLPSHALNHPASSGYMMPTWAGSCRVFFPGTYLDPITIADAVPTYFTSGVYDFENTVTFGARANVVVGEGAYEGCTTNAEAAYYAINAPATVSISGIGATFVFGGAGRLVVTDSGTATGPSVLFNARLVDATVSAGVSIESVNGVAASSTSSSDLLIAGYLNVPKSHTQAKPADAAAPPDAASTGYISSTLVPQPAPAAEVTPIIDVQITGTGTTTLYIPGYVAVPQGRINLNVGAASAAGASLQLLGGVLAGKITVAGATPATLQWGLVNRIVQKTFKLVATTTGSGDPKVTSTAIVQINDYGEYAINSWVTSI